MDALAAAQATAEPVSKVTSHFMIAGKTYKRGAELGFAGVDFYMTGRGGVLGDVDPDVVSAAFMFMEPGHLRELWEQGTAVMSPSEAGAAFAACAYTWAEAHVPDAASNERLAELAGKLAAGANLACAPVFAAWRRLPVPDSPKAAVVHHLNGLRELRQALHSACLLAEGLTPLQALALNAPQMAPIFGWGELPDTEGLAPRWEQAEEATTRAMAHSYEALTGPERAEFAELAQALHVATSG